MGQDPNADADIAILDGGFMNPGVWRTAHPWSVAGGFAVLNQTLHLGNWMGQFNIPFIPGQVYRIIFTMSLANFPTPGQGVRFQLSGNQDNTVFRTNGTHYVDIMALNTAEIVSWEHVPWTIGDSCKIDNMLVAPLGNYVQQELEIVTRTPYKFEFANAVQTDHYQLMASWTDKTNILISYNT